MERGESTTLTPTSSPYNTSSDISIHLNMLLKTSLDCVVLPDEIEQMVVCRLGILAF